MTQMLTPELITEIENHFFHYVQLHIEQLERNYLLELPHGTFIAYCFGQFCNHCRQVYDSKYNTN